MSEKSKAAYLPTRVWAPILGVYALALIGGAWWLVRDIDQSTILDDPPAVIRSVDGSISAK